MGKSGRGWAETGGGKGGVGKLAVGEPGKEEVGKSGRAWAEAGGGKGGVGKLGRGWAGKGGVGKSGRGWTETGGGRGGGGEGWTAAGWLAPAAAEFHARWERLGWRWPCGTARRVEHIPWRQRSAPGWRKDPRLRWWLLLLMSAAMERWLEDSGETRAAGRPRVGGAIAGGDGRP